MRLLLLLFVFLSLNSPVRPQAVTGRDVFNTTGFDCSPEKKYQGETWKNDLGDIRIYNALLWMGASGATVADIGAVVYRTSDDSILFHENWDHYAEPTGMHTDRLDLTPNYMALENGDSLSLSYWCQSFNGNPSQANIIVTIWYTK